MWEISLSDQLLTFLCGIFFGILLCVYYDIIRAALLSRRSGKVTIFFGDIFFWTTTAFATFLFLLSRTNGELRGYVFISMGIGFLFFKFTLSKILMLVLVFLFTQYYKLLRLIGCFFLKILELLSLLFVRMGNLFKKSLNCVKKLLKKSYKLLYTMFYNRHKESCVDETQEGPEEKA